MINEIENAIVARLASQISGADIRAFPESADEFSRLPLGRPRIFVAYAGSAFSEPTNKDVIIQEQLLEFEITVQMRNLREHNGAYSFLESVYSALSGFSPKSDSKVMYVTAERLVNFENNIWTWAQTWQLRERRSQ